MLPQNCSRIHYPLSLNLPLQKNQNSEKTVFENTLNICCFDYLINLDEFYSDNLMNNYYYYQFTKIVYNFDKKNILDFSNYNKDSLFKFIIILSKVCCNYYIREKIKYSKFLSNLSVRIIQNYFKKYINGNNLNNNISNNKLNKKNNNISNDLKNNNIVSNIYNNACCNYFKTLSYNKCLKFLEYSNKNIEENDINSKLIYYNNALIISSKINNTNNIDNYIKMINKLILLKRKYFDNIYLNNIYYNNSNNIGNGTLKNSLKKNEEHYNNFKLLCFIMYNYAYAIEKLLNQKKQAKKYYQNSYEYICKYLGKNSLEAQKFLFKIKNKNNNFESLYFSINEDNNNILDIKKRNFTPIIIREKNNKNNNNNYDNDIDLRLNSILKKIENFEEILKNNEILNNLIKNKNDLDNNTINDLKINNINNSNNNLNHEEKIINNTNEIINKSISFDNSNNYNNLENKNKEININNFYDEDIKLNKNENIINNNETKKENIKTDINAENKINLENNKDNKKNNKIKEKITFDMMDNIIEEFKKESQEKMEKQKKLKEENDKKEKENKEKENKDIKIKIDKVENNNNDETQPKKPLRIKKLFQKVLGRQEKEMPKTKLGELFQSLMKNPQNEKKKGMDEGGKEIKVGKESENNLINLDEDEDEDEIKVNNNNIKTEVENNYNDINKDNLNNKPKSGFGYKINVNLDKSEYSYDAVTFFQESNTSE